MMIKQEKKNWNRQRLMPFVIDPTSQTASSGLSGHTWLIVGLAINFYEDP
jgi:hypothetical protein